MPQVIFQPDGAAIEVEPGIRILEAARRAGVHVRNDCGGQGVCGKCQVEVRRGEVERLGTQHQLPPGRDLACRTLVTDASVEVFLPPESQKLQAEVSLVQEQPFPHNFPPDTALVQRVKLQLPKPSLDDNRADRERLLEALERWRSGSYHIPLHVLRHLPQTLRRSRWRPQVTLAVGPSGTDVLGFGSRQKRPVILAVDVGTTTIKARLLAPGNPWSASCLNSQGIYGPDVITRIIYCDQNQDGLARLQELAASDINRLLQALLEKSELKRDDVWAVVVSGNTTMMHLLLGLAPSWIRREPYVGCTYQPPPVPAGELGIDINPAGVIVSLPSVSAYVGADIAAGVLATSLHEAPRPRMLIDLGTNGEIVIGSRDFMVCCSASAGPAFEGGGSSSGSWARPGAIESVWVDDEVRWRTLGGARPIGICGTGYIDLLAALMQTGVIDKTGRLQQGSSPALRTREDESTEYVLVTRDATATGLDIVLSQADIDNLIRAKGAIYAASRVLLNSLGMDWNDLDRIMLAGGFGERIEVPNAISIGLLPDVAADRIEFVGNTSLKGAVLVAAEVENYTKIKDITSGMTYLELSTRPEFMEEFVSACFLPHTNMEDFPSVASPIKS